MRPSVRQTQDCGVSGCSWVPSGGRDARMAADIILWWTLSSCREEWYMRVGVWRARKSGSHNYQSGCALKVFAFMGVGGGGEVDSCLYQKSGLFHSQSHAESPSWAEINQKTYKPNLLGCNITGEEAFIAKVLWMTCRACVMALAPPGGRPPTLRSVRGNGLVWQFSLHTSYYMESMKIGPAFNNIPLCALNSHVFFLWICTQIIDCFTVQQHFMAFSMWNIC